MKIITRRCFFSMLLTICFILLVFGEGGVRADPLPVIYDDFSDGRLQSRTGTDPWGRKLPEWTLSGTWDASSGEARTDDGNISLSCNIIKGTWKFRYRYINAPPTGDYTQGLSVEYIMQSSGSGIHFNNPTDGHWWLDYWARAEIADSWPRASQSYPYINMVGSCIGPARVAGTSWYEVVFIRDERFLLPITMFGKKYSQALFHFIDFSK